MSQHVVPFQELFTKEVVKVSNAARRNTKASGHDLRKPRLIIQTFEEVLHTPVGRSIQLSKPNDESRLTEWEYVCPAAPNVFRKSVKDNIQDIVTYTQQLSMAQEFHSEDIKLLLEAVTKHFLRHSEFTC